ncbi:alpha/beta fold hydrolase [Paenibacillus sp. GCM10027626]|uniref:alpha/beta fold hydrolase n=1 Tax=Paenibacillus sp. GCM10027626 TaxID=3273411 RepID=UPI00362EF6CB
MEHIIRDGYKLAILEQGPKENTPIFVIGSAIYYPRLFAHDVFADLHLVFIDHRGFAKSANDNAPYSLDDIVEDIEAVRVKLNDPKVILFGHSGHGFMAMAYANKYPERVSAMILANLAPTNAKERQEGSIAYFEQTADEARKQYFYTEIAKLENDIKQDPEHRFSHMNIRMQAHSFYQYDFNGAYLWDDVVNNMPALDYLWGVEFAAFDTLSALQHLKAPCLLMLSEYDYLVSPISLWDAYLEKVPSIKKVVFEKSGHNPMLEEPEKFAQTLRSFTTGL